MTPEPDDPPPAPAVGRLRIVPPERFDRPRPTDSALPLKLAPLVPLYVIDVLTVFTIGILPPVLPLVAAGWALSPVEVGLVNTVYAIGRLASAYPATLARVRWGTRAAVFLGLGGLVAGLLACAVAPRFPVFLLGRLVMGLGSSLAFVSIFAELLDAAPTARRGRLASAFEATSIVSIAVGGTLAAVVGEAAGWRTVFAVAAGLTLPALLAGRTLGPEAGRRAGAPALGGRWVPGAELRVLAPVYVASLAMSATWAGLFYTLVPLLGHDRYGLSTSTIGLAFAAAYVVQLAGLLLVGLTIDRVPREPVYLAGALAVQAGGLTLAVASGPGLFVLGLSVLASGFAVWMIPATVLVDRAGTPVPPAHLAAYRILVDAGMIVGPVILGAAAELAGDRPAVGAAGLVLVAGALVLGWRPRRSGRPRRPSV